MFKRLAFAALAAATLAILAGFVGASVDRMRTQTAPWAAEQDRLPTAVHNFDGSITLHHVRDWTYADHAIVGRAWTDLTIDPHRITRAWFLLEPFSQWKAMGHTFLSFEVKDGPAVSFSVEARMRSGQVWSGWRGAFGAYPLAYQWGTERDFVTRRLLYLHHGLRFYALTISQRQAQDLFLELLDETNTLASRPRRYNTLIANCTNTLALIVNRGAPRTLPWSPAWQLPGLADGYLMKHGFIALDGGSVDQTRAHNDVANRLSDVRAIAEAPPSDFSTGLRAIMSRTGTGDQVAFSPRRRRSFEPAEARSRQPPSSL